MHDMMGNAGMLRGWVSIWTTQLLWLLAGLTISVGVTATVELLMTGRVRRARAALPGPENTP